MILNTLENMKCYVANLFSKHTSSKCGYSDVKHNAGLKPELLPLSKTSLTIIHQTTSK